MRPAVDGNPTSQRGHGRTPGRGAEQTTGEADQYAWQHQHQHQHQAQTPMPQFAHPMTYAGHHHQAPCAPPTHAHQPFHPLATDPQPYHQPLHHPPLPPQLSFAYQQYSAPASAPGPSPFTALPESHYYHGQRHDQREGEAPTVGGRAAAQGPVQLCCHQCKTKRPESMFTLCTVVGLRNRSCKKKYCSACLKRIYHIDPSGLDQSTWHCPSCESRCTCAGCTRARRGLIQTAAAAGVVKTPSEAASDAASSADTSSSMTDGPTDGRSSALKLDTADTSPSMQRIQSLPSISSGIFGDSPSSQTTPRGQVAHRKLSAGSPSSAASKPRGLLVPQQTLTRVSSAGTTTVGLPPPTARISRISSANAVLGAGWSESNTPASCSPSSAKFHPYSATVSSPAMARKQRRSASITSSGNDTATSNNSSPSSGHLPTNFAAMQMHQTELPPSALAALQQTGSTRSSTGNSPIVGHTSPYNFSRESPGHRGPGPSRRNQSTRAPSQNSNSTPRTPTTPAPTPLGMYPSALLQHMKQEHAQQLQDLTISQQRLEAEQHSLQLQSQLLDQQERATRLLFHSRSQSESTTNLVSSRFSPVSSPPTSSTFSPHSASTAMSPNGHHGVMTAWPPGPQGNMQSYAPQTPQQHQQYDHRQQPLQSFQHPYQQQQQHPQHSAPTRPYSPHQQPPPFASQQYPPSGSVVPADGADERLLSQRAQVMVLQRQLDHVLAERRALEQAAREQSVLIAQRAEYERLVEQLQMRDSQVRADLEQKRKLEESLAMLLQRQRELQERSRREAEIALAAGIPPYQPTSAAAAAASSDPSSHPMDLSQGVPTTSPHHPLFHAGTSMKHSSPMQSSPARPTAESASSTPSALDASAMQSDTNSSSSMPNMQYGQNSSSSGEPTSTLDAGAFGDSLLLSGRDGSTSPIFAANMFASPPLEKEKEWSSSFLNT